MYPYLGMQQEFFNEIMSMSQAMQSLVRTKFYLIGQKINGVGGWSAAAGQGI